MKLKEFKLSDQAEQVLQFAEQAARTFRHEYVGTEHLLLGLILQGEGIAATALRSRGLDEACVRQEIEEIIHHGPHEVSTHELPLTPRSQRALEFGAEEARVVGLEVADTEHVLLGLLRELESVAGLILHKHGLDVDELRQEVLKIRFLQMKIVERVVRPLRADSARKRKMRDELLAHLSAIYDEELARLGNPIVAFEAAAERFGNPDELCIEMQMTVPRRERWEFQFESWFGWHAPETVMRWMTRLGIQLGLAMGGACVLVSLLAFREFGWSYSLWLTIRPVVGAAIVLPFSVATTGICYYKMRDHLFGVFGSRKSWKRVIGWAALMTASMVWSGFVFIAVSYSSLATAQSFVVPFLAAGILWSASNLMAVNFFGPQEIRDTAWALLDLKDGPDTVE